MNTRYAQDEELDESELHESELTLSTPILLGIFFGIVLICGIFFGIGYSMGRRSGEAKAIAAVQNAAQNTSPEGTGSNALPKPSAIQQMPAADSQAPTALSAESASPQAQSAAEPASEHTQQVVQDTAPRLTPVPTAAKPVKPVTAAPSSPATAAPDASAAGTIMVQVAAVSHQPDAEALVAALKRKGYNAAIHSESQDKLLHVQVGPFSSRAEAAAKRQQLLAEGYNAIIK